MKPAYLMTSSALTIFDDGGTPMTLHADDGRFERAIELLKEENFDDLIDLINLDSLYVAAPLDELDAAQIRPGMATRITLDAFPETSFNGRTRAVSPSVFEEAKQARTVELEVDFIER